MTFLRKNKNQRFPKSGFNSNFLLISLICLLLLSSYVLAADYIVPDDYATITEALAVAISGDRVLVKEGYYSPSSNGEIFPLNMKTGVDLIAVGTGPSILDPQASAASPARVITAQNVSGYESNSIDLTGFTILNGYTTGNGGGIYWSNGNYVNIAYNLIYNNYAANGAGMALVGLADTCYVYSNIVTNNQAGTHGGGVYLYNSDCELNDNVIRGNQAAGKGGGVVLDYYSDGYVLRNFVFENQAGDDAGGIYIHYYSDPGLLDNSILANTASQTAGGLLVEYYSHPQIWSSTFADNNAGIMAGGAYFINNCSPDVLFCTFADNTSPNAGGIRFQDYCYSVVKNSIFWNNGDDIYVAQLSNPAVTYCDIQDGDFPTKPGNISADPLFVPGQNGEFYLTQIAAGGVWDSPCLNAGDNNASYYEMDGYTMDNFTTRIDNVTDSGIVDMGRHYSTDNMAPAEVVIETPTPNQVYYGSIPVSINVNKYSVPPTSFFVYFSGGGTSWQVTTYNNGSSKWELNWDSTLAPDGITWLEAYADDLTGTVFNSDGWADPIQIILDNYTPPYTQNHNPAPGQSSVVLDTNIALEVVDDYSGVDDNTISMQVEVNSMPVAGTLSLTGIQNGYALLFDPAADFNQEEEVQVTVDAADNVGNYMTTEVYTFTTIGAPPYVQNINPAPYATNVLPSTNIFFDVYDDGTGVDPTSIKLYVEEFNVTNRCVISLIGDNDYHVMYNPQQDFCPGVVINVSIKAADLYDPPNQMITYSYYFTISGVNNDITPPPFDGIQYAIPTGEPGQVLVGWDSTVDDCNNPPTYNIYYSVNSASVFIAPQITGVSNLFEEYVVTGLLGCKDYFFGVRAVDALGNEDDNTVIIRAVPAMLPIAWHQILTFVMILGFFMVFVGYFKVRKNR